MSKRKLPAHWDKSVWTYVHQQYMRGFRQRAILSQLASVGVKMSRPDLDRLLNAVMITEIPEPVPSTPGRIRYANHVLGLPRRTA